MPTSPRENMTDSTDGRLYADRLQLHPIGPESAVDLSTGGAGGFRWVADGPYEGTRDACTMAAKAAQAGVFAPRWGVYAVVRTEDGAAVGGIGFHGPPSEGSAEIGYDLAASQRGRGYATEAVAVISAFALDQPEVDVVVAHTEPGNTASQAVVVRAGFVRDGEGEDGLFRFVLRRG